MTGSLRTSLEQAGEGSRILLVDLNAAPFTREFFDALNGYATGGSGRCLETLAIWNAHPAPPPPSVSIDNGSRPQEAVPTEGLSPLVVALCESLRDNDDPNEPIADNGASVIDGWRDLARRILSTPQPADGCSRNEGADGWIEWSGGENPVPGEVVEARFTGGFVSEALDSESFGWDRHNDPVIAPMYDIIAYRILPQTEKGS